MRVSRRQEKGDKQVSAQENQQERQRMKRTPAVFHGQLLPSRFFPNGDECRSLSAYGRTTLFTVLAVRWLFDHASVLDECEVSDRLRARPPGG
jgi:hypothetical protein